jgi:hypothetical protein
VERLETRVEEPDSERGNDSELQRNRQKEAKLAVRLAAAQASARCVARQHGRHQLLSSFDLAFWICLEHAKMHSKGFIFIWKRLQKRDKISQKGPIRGLILIGLNQMSVRKSLKA